MQFQELRPLRHVEHLTDEEIMHRTSLCIIYLRRMSDIVRVAASNHEIHSENDNLGKSFSGQSSTNVRFDQS